MINIFLQKDGQRQSWLLLYNLKPSGSQKKQTKTNQQTSVSSTTATPRFQIPQNEAAQMTSPARQVKKNGNNCLSSHIPHDTNAALTSDFNWLWLKKKKEGRN